MDVMLVITDDNGAGKLLVTKNLRIVDTTVGLAQVKMSTARDLIKKKYFSADPGISSTKLYSLLSEDNSSVRFAAAYLHFIREFRQ